MKNLLAALAVLALVAALSAVSYNAGNKAGFEEGFDSGVHDLCQEVGGKPNPSPFATCKMP